MHQTEGNQQTMTIIDSEGSLDTSACQISGHSFYPYVLPRECTETPNLIHFISKSSQNEENQQTMTKN